MLNINGAVTLLAIASLISLAESQAVSSETANRNIPDAVNAASSDAIAAELQLAASDVTPIAATDVQGNINVPENYRTQFQYLGSWAVAKSDGKGSEQIHVVYASPDTVEGFRKDGHFSEGTILVKEVYEATTAEMTTGTVSREGALKGWFVMVRDTRNSHPGNKLWGDGWGWSWFDASNAKKTTSTDYKTDCLGCHVPAKSTDWIYVSGYPPLK
jgi:Cytochrome P460